MVMAEDFAGFSLRSGRQIPPTLLAVTKKGPLFFTPASLQDDRSKDDFADTARLICIAYQVPAAVMILESWMKMAAEGEKLDPDERPSEAMDRHEVVMVMGEAAGTTQRKVFKIIRTDAGGSFGLTEWEGLPMAQLEAESSLRAVNSVCQPRPAAIFAKSFSGPTPPFPRRRRARIRISEIGNEKPSSITQLPIYALTPCSCRHLSTKSGQGHDGTNECLLLCRVRVALWG